MHVHNIHSISYQYHPFHLPSQLHRLQVPPTCQYCKLFHCHSCPNTANSPTLNLPPTMQAQLMAQFLQNATPMSTLTYNLSTALIVNSVADYCSYPLLQLPAMITYAQLQPTTMVHTSLQLTTVRVHASSAATSNDCLHPTTIVHAPLQLRMVMAHAPLQLLAIACAQLQPTMMVHAPLQLPATIACAQLQPMTISTAANINGPRSSASASNDHPCPATANYDNGSCPSAATSNDRPYLATV